MLDKSTYNKVTGKEKSEDTGKVITRLNHIRWNLEHAINRRQKGTIQNAATGGCLDELEDYMAGSTQQNKTMIEV
jgi:hypothetical protein